MLSEMYLPSVYLKNVSRPNEVHKGPGGGYSTSDGRVDSTTSSLNGDRCKGMTWVRMDDQVFIKLLLSQSRANKYHLILGTPNK
jgi:hypothetical protein